MSHHASSKALAKLPHCGHKWGEHECSLLNPSMHGTTHICLCGESANIVLEEDPPNLSKPSGVWLPENNLAAWRKNGTANEKYLVELVDSLAAEVNRLRAEKEKGKGNNGK